VLVLPCRIYRWLSSQSKWKEVDVCNIWAQFSSLNILLAVAYGVRFAIIPCYYDQKDLEKHDGSKIVLKPFT
jgi:hypothetical protein